MPARRLNFLSGFSLQTRLLCLVLLPLLVVTVSLVLLNAQERAADTRAALEAQRGRLVEFRKAAIRDVVNTAKSAIAPIVANSELSDPEARERAAEVLRAIRFDGNNYIFVYRYDGTNIVLPHSPEREGKDLSDLQSPNGDYIVKDFIEVGRKGGGFYEYPWEYPGTSDIEPKQSYIADIPEFGWVLGTGAYVRDIEETMAGIEAAASGELRKSILSAALTGLAIFLGVALLAAWLVRQAVRPIRETSMAMSDIARGKGDLTRRLTVHGRDEVGELATQFNAFVERMQHTLIEVRGSTREVTYSAQDISRGSEELASRTEQSAANLQETSASMEEITSTVNNSAESAQQANQLVTSTADVARQGEQAMQQVERTMGDIRTSAERISEIITLIDGIAFQTNILALNASVEAARAGEHGRGFAVVAQEVRSLASRSSDASKEIRELIDVSVAHARDGSTIVQRAGGTMQEIVESVARVTDVIAEISAGAREQSSGIGQINTAVAELDTMTQQNAAMVSQASSSAAEMTRHAEQLRELVDSFILGEDSAYKASPSETAPTLMHKVEKRKRMERAAVADEWEAF